MRINQLEYCVEVLALSTQRRPAQEARLLYREEEASQRAREEQVLLLKAERVSFPHGDGRPTRRRAARSASSKGNFKRRFNARHGLRAIHVFNQEPVRAELQIMSSSASPAVSLLPFSLFYFSYFAFQGLFSPFWGLYLQSLSFSAWQISVLMALSTLARIVAPGFWGWLADRRGRRRAIILTTSLLSAAAFLLVGMDRAFWWVFVSLAVSHFFWAAALPLVEASTAHLTRAQPGRYSRVRVWGSIGFVCLAMSGGLLLDGIGIGNLPWALCALLALVAVAAWRVPEVAAERKGGPSAPIAATLRRPEVMALFGCCFLMAFAHGPYYTFSPSA